MTETSPFRLTYTPNINEFWWDRNQELLTTQVIGKCENRTQQNRLENSKMNKLHKMSSNPS